MTANAGLTTSLRSLVSALQTNQATLSYISDNIANVNTKGYTRRIVAQETQVSAGSSAGVNVTEIRRAVDVFLLRSVQAQVSKTAEASTINEYTDRLQNFSFGNPNSPYTINNAINEFYSRLESFAGEASSGVKRNLVINSAKDFTDTVNSLSRNIEQERFNADSEISSTVENLNEILTNLNDINKAIGQATAVDGDVQTLYDARDVQLNNVKEILDADFTYDDNGKVSISLASSELLGFSQKYDIEYNRLSSIDSLINKGKISAISVYNLNTAGERVGVPSILLSDSEATNKVDNIPAGKLRALVDLRDEKLPKILQQLDVYVYTFANEFNVLHNSGSGYPPATQLSGKNLVDYDSARNYEGKFRVALIDETGAPVTGRSGEKMIPLTIDFSKFNGASGFGTATTRDIINEINSYYGAQPANTANIGSAKDIRIGAVSSSVNTLKAAGSLTFVANPVNLDTIVVNGTTITFVTGVPVGNQVQIGGNITTTISNLTEFLNNSGDANIAQSSYSSAGSVINITNKTGGIGGNSFSLNVAGTSAITASGATLTGGANATGNFEFDFDFSNLSEDGSAITFDVSQISINGGGASAVTFNNYTQQAGDRQRTNRNGVSGDTLSVALGALNLQEGSTFTITATINVVDSNNVTKTENVTFTVTVPDPQDNILNNRFPATAIGSGGDGELVASSATAGFMNARFVNEDGLPITDFSEQGYLKIETLQNSFRLSLDQLDSKEKGKAVANPSATATNRGLSTFFGMNNFFDLGDSQTGSAIKFQVRDDILSNPSLLSSGKVKQSVATGTSNVYTYELGSGSNESVLDMIKLQDRNLKFASAGGLPELITTADFYASEIYSFSASEANSAKSTFDKETLLSDALNTKFDDVSGVNLDQELALTIQIQNAYSAAARVLGIVRELFEKIDQVIA